MKKNPGIKAFIRRHLLRIMIGITVILSVTVITLWVNSFLISRKADRNSDILNATDSETPDFSTIDSLTTENTSLEGSASTLEPVLTSASEPTPAETAPAETTPSTTSPPSTAAPTSEPTAAPTPIGPVWYDGFVDPRTVEYEIITNPDDLTVLINKYYAISEDYIPELVPAASSADQKLRPEANSAWDLMRAACLEDTGKTLYLTAGYSTFEQRIALFEGAIKKVNDGVTGFSMKRVVSKYAYPGRSEHNVGLALDIREINDSDISSNFLNTTAGAWMSDHAHEYGFILRYPSGKGAITGYDFEAWHFRYVGVDLATTLYTNDQTLEEYYGKEQALP
jgi:D-alanyl-D-alanine carboxypeptidase